MNPIVFSKFESFNIQYDLCTQTYSFTNTLPVGTSIAGAGGQVGATAVPFTFTFDFENMTLVRAARDGATQPLVCDLVRRPTWMPLVDAPPGLPK